MPTYRLTVEYDGTEFHGWQVQPHARTAAGTLFAALRQVTGAEPHLTAAGRTDAGAHAHGQVAGVTLARAWEPQRLQARLNALLPADLVVTGVELCGAGFDARRDAISRTYRYVVLSRAERAAVTRRHAWIVRGPFDVEAMSAAARELTGTHDFCAFGRPPYPQGRTVRTVHEVRIDRITVDGDPSRLDGVMITVRANAFLRGMMRAFAGLLIAVGQGRRSPDSVRALVSAPEPSASPLQPAPAHGLHQWKVEYGAENTARVAA